MSLAIGIGPSIANHLWQSTAFATVCGLLTLALRRNPARVRHGLWLAASLKFLVPFSILVNIGGLFPTPRPASLASPAVMSSAIDAASPFGNSIPANVSSAAPVQPMPHAPSLLPRLLLIAWLVGFCSVIIVWCHRWRHVSVTVRDAEIVNARARNRNPAPPGIAREIRQANSDFAHAKHDGARNLRSLPPGATLARTIERTTLRRPDRGNPRARAGARAPP